MQPRFTAKGLTTDDKQVILAYELKQEEFKVELYIVLQKSLKGDAQEKLEVNWVNGETFDFPTATVQITPNLNSESVLPEDIRSEEAGKIRAKQNEWAYSLLTAKLWEVYLHELDELKKKSENLSQYDRKLFDDAKSFWERVLEHRKERDISQSSLDKIKDDVNTIFEKLKTFRKTESADFESASNKLRVDVVAKLDDLKNRANEKANFKLLLEEFKVIQNDSRKNKYSKSDDALLRKLFDSIFQYINSQRNHFLTDMNASRVKGLNEVIENMTKAINRDKSDLESMKKKSESNKASSLELQLIKVKSSMLLETINSKEEKLKDIYLTLENLTKQANKNKKKESSPKVKEEIEVKTTITKTKIVESTSETIEPETTEENNEVNNETVPTSLPTE